VSYLLQYSGVHDYAASSGKDGVGAAGAIVLARSVTSTVSTYCMAPENPLPTDSSIRTRQ
jgi:hypothetical protein